MSKNKFKILIAGWIGVMTLGIFSFGIVNASNSLIYITPNNLNKKVGDAFVLVATVDTAGSKVCAVEGTLQLDKLSCQNIVLGEGIMAQKQPSCADPSFLLGIPSCTIVNKALFTVAVKGEKVGNATVGFADVDVIGEGFSLSNTSVGGNYNLSAVSTVKPAIIPEVVPAENCACENWGEWQRVDCGAGDCESTQLAQTRSRVCSPNNCEVTVENRCVTDAYCASVILPTDDESQTASVLGSTVLAKYGWLFGLIILLIVGGGAYFLGKKRK